MTFGRTWSSDGSYKLHSKKNTKQRVLSHRRSSAKYYAANPDIREKQRQRRRELSLNNLKRSRKSVTPVQSEAGHLNTSSGPAPEAPPSAQAPDMLTNHEEEADIVAAAVALVALEDRPEIPPLSPAAVSSAPLDTVQLESMTAARPLPPQASPELLPGVTELSAEQKRTLKAGGKLFLTRVQRAQTSVAELNRQLLTQPSADERASWTRSGAHVQVENSVGRTEGGFSSAIMAWRSGVVPTKARRQLPVFPDMRRRRDPQLVAMEAEAKELGERMVAKFGRPFEDEWAELEAVVKEGGSGDLCT
ncbi:hypothetical protein MKEN_01309300 [Mycena kentingensis (nom. inval.)]|nr:hypothetical protein MKEN_01309300 [Mycena kentingensis (nom. inval.)]